MRNIILVGFMGSGKSALGRILAKRLGMTLVDMDQVITHRQGRSINRIFDEEGEAYFRHLERALVQELSKQNNLVISTGGGVVLDPGNIRDFEQTGDVICLDASVETILKRVGGDRNRPLLQTPDPETTVRDLLASRKPCYEAIQWHVNTDSGSLEEVAEAIFEQLAGRN